MGDFEVRRVLTVFDVVQADGGASGTAGGDRARPPKSPSEACCCGGAGTFLA